MNDEAKDEQQQKDERQQRHQQQQQPDNQQKEQQLGRRHRRNHTKGESTADSECTCSDTPAPARSTVRLRGTQRRTNRRRLPRLAEEE